MSVVYMLIRYTLGQMWADIRWVCLSATALAQKMASILNLQGNNKLQSPLSLSSKEEESIIS